MTKLKTLKDFWLIKNKGDIANSDVDIFAFNLRQEAIKRAILLLSKGTEILNNRPGRLGKEDLLLLQEHTKITGQLEWIIDFFNLSEEDIKNE